MASTTVYMALDVGERRIGVALADSQVAIAVPYDFIEVDGTELEQLVKLASFEKVNQLVVGYPRNQSGEPTAQTASVQAFTDKLMALLSIPMAYQDESVTSVQAETHLKATNRPYTKGDIDSMAASIILQDYLEQHRGRV